MNSVFALGNKCFDIFNTNLQTTFLPNHSLHGTGKPSKVNTMPRSLVGNCNFDTVFNDKLAIHSFVSKSIVAWGTWERRRAVTNKAKREQERKEDLKLPSIKRTRKRGHKKARKDRMTKQERANRAQLNVSTNCN